MSNRPIIHTAHLFDELDAHLVTLLKSLSSDEWRLPTIVPRWSVHQVAAHLLDTAMRRLSICRDAWVPPAAVAHSEEGLIDAINRINAEGVVTLGRYSPELLISLTEIATRELAMYFASLDPYAHAPFAVSWAGEQQSRNWFDIAREYTERWHHQQQIRVATNRPGIMTPRLYAPVLETFMRALPHTFRQVEAADGATCDVIVPGDCGGTWRVVYRAGGWSLDASEPTQPDARAIISEDVAWRLFTKGVSGEEARQAVRLEGDRRLAAVVLRALAIVG